MEKKSQIIVSNSKIARFFVPKKIIIMSFCVFLRKHILNLNVEQKIKFPLQTVTKAFVQLQKTNLIFKMSFAKIT